MRTSPLPEEMSTSLLARSTRMSPLPVVARSFTPLGSVTVTRDEGGPPSQSSFQPPRPRSHALRPRHTPQSVTPLASFWTSKDISLLRRLRRSALNSTRLPVPSRTSIGPLKCRIPTVPPEATTPDQVNRLAVVSWPAAVPDTTATSAAGMRTGSRRCIGKALRRRSSALETADRPRWFERRQKQPQGTRKLPVTPETDARVYTAQGILLSAADAGARRDLGR